jgi:CAAX amino terminal protease family.
LTAPVHSRSKRSLKSLRPLWLIVAFYLICSITLGVFQTVGQLTLGASAVSSRGILFQWLALGSVLVATYLMLRRVDRLPWSTIGLDTLAASPRLLLRGAVFGGLTIGLASVALISINELRIDQAAPGNWWAAAGTATWILLPAAFFEELFIRGYAFAVLRRAAGWKMALIVTSLVFGLLHAWNPGADAESILAVTVAGFFLGAIFLATRSLYAAGAAHFAWNWVMAGALHTPVSGLPLATPDYKVVDAGPDWLTGGPWGPEGGVAAVVAMFAVLFYLYGRHLRRMEWPA